jgi:methionyl-tRNA formyltransferase
MKAIVITQNEPFYIPLLVERFISDYKTVIAIVTLPGTPKGFTQVSFYHRLYELFGLNDFFRYGLLYVNNLGRDILSKYLRFGRYYSVKSIARKNDIPLYNVSNINDIKSIEILKSYNPDVIISVASPQIFKNEILNLSKYVINIHAALLPRYRGMMPSFWVLAKGETATGVTVHHISNKIDQGNILIQMPIEISPQDTLHSLQTKVANIGAIALLKALKDIDSNPIGYPQEGTAMYYSFPTKEDANEFRKRGRKFI